jgi:LPS-assembly protein
MSPRARPSWKAALRVLMAGALAVGLWSTAALAQPAPADGLAAGEMYLEAVEIARDDKTKITTAQGSVEVRYGGRTLKADQVIHDEARGVIRAKGNVQIINADGSSEFANEVVLDDKMKAGVALGFSARLSESIHIASASAARRSGASQELNKAIYTPCEICRADGSPKTPTWSISADRVVQDEARRIVHYRNARIHVRGVPVLFLPVFWHADPQAQRASGLLAPKASASDRRGLSYEQPYLIVLSPSSDLTFSPQINTKVNPLLNAEYRKRFYSGDLNVRFGYTHDRDFDGRGKRIGVDTSRSYVLGHGAFRPAEKWRAGFTAERTSDDLLFDKYEVGDVYETRGPYLADDRRLISQVYAIRQDRRSYVSAAAMSIQGLRPDDIDRTFPTVAPLVEAHYEAPTPVLGGRLRLHGGAVALNRDQSPLNPALRLPGLDSRRVTGELDWRRNFTSKAGLRLDAFLMARADSFNLDDILTGASAATRSRTTSRVLAVGGVDISYPLFRRWRDATVVLEPVAQLALSPDAHQIRVGPVAGQPLYLNEDSVAFEFDETTLFRPNKFPGYDLYEDGARLNVAGRAAVHWDDGRRASLLVGRAFRTRANDVFPARSGLRGEASDWVVAADAQPVRGLTVFTRARIDDDNLQVRRLEAGLNAVNRFGSGYIRYLTDDFDINGVKRENLDLGAEVALGKSWGVTAYGNRDLRQQAWVIRDLGVFYRDDCLRVDVIYRQEDTIIGRLGPSKSINLRLTLATLGGPPYAR